MENKKTVDTLGYTPEEHKKFTKNAWIVLLGFSVLYCALYWGRANYAVTMADKSQTLFTDVEYGIPLAVFFWTYGMGHLFNGRLGEIFGVKKFIVAGLFLSVITNVIVGFQSSLAVIIALWAVNGYFQSMLWSPGIALLTRWWPGKRRGFATGFANAFSSLGSVTAALLVVWFIALAPNMGWRAGFVFPGLLAIVVCLIFIFVVKRSPDAIGLKDYVEGDEKRNLQDQELMRLMKEKGKLYPYAHLLKQWRFDMWLLIVAGSNIARWGLLSWIPKYYVDKFDIDISESIVGIVMLPLGMAFGTLIIPWISDKFFSHNRLPMVILCAAVAGTTVFFFIKLAPGALAYTLLFIAGFFIYAINGLVWAYATDVGGRAFAGTAAGVLDCAAYLGASVQALVFPAIKEATGSWTTSFLAIVGVCAAIIIFALIASRGLSKAPQSGDNA